MYKIIRYAVVTMLLFEGLAMVLGQSTTQQTGPSSKQAALGRSMHNFLRQPDGIQKISDKVGDVYLTEPEEIWGQHSLASLTSGSDIVVLGKINSYTSRLSQDGDSIESQYRFTPFETLKGTLLDDMQLVVSGGAVQLSNGHVASVHTPLFDGLQLGESYLLFLRSQGSHLVLVGASQGALHLNRVSGKMELLPASHNSSLAAVLKDQSVEEVKSDIHQAR